MARYGHISLKGLKVMVAHSYHVIAQQLEVPAWKGPGPRIRAGREERRKGMKRKEGGWEGRRKEGKINEKY
jgi:hypothetical protein